MIVNDHATYIELVDEYNDSKSFADYLERVVPERYSENNVVVSLAKYAEITLGHLLHFLNVSNTHRAGKKSFVLVCDRVEIDDIPMEMIVVPTLQEAGDIVEMEEIERDLGF